MLENSFGVNTMLRRVLVFGLVMVAVLATSATSQARQTQVELTIIIDDNSLTVYVPGNQVVSLSGLTFEWRDEDGIQTQLLESYPAFGINFQRVAAPICFRLVRDGTSPSLPQVCQNLPVMFHTLTDADVFWYDRLNSQRRPITVLNLNTVESAALCPAGPPECDLIYVVPETGTNLPTPATAPSATPLTTGQSLPPHSITLSGDCPADLEARLRLDPAFVEIGTGSSGEVSVTCIDDDRLDISVDFTRQMRLVEVVEPARVQVDDVSVTNGGTLINALAGYVHGGDYVSTAFYFDDAAFQLGETAPPELVLLGANSWLFARCYADAIFTYALVIDDFPVAAANNRGVARLNLADYLTQSTPDPIENCPSGAAAPAMSPDSLLEDAYDDFTTVIDNSTAVDEQALALVNRAVIPLLQTYDIAQTTVDCRAARDHAEDADTRALADLCLAALDVLAVNTQLLNDNACDLGLLTGARDRLTHAQSSLPWLVDYWNGYLLYYESLPTCTSNPSTRSRMADQSRSSFERYLQQIQRPGMIRLDLERTNISNLCRQFDLQHCPNG